MPKLFLTTATAIALVAAPVAAAAQTAAVPAAEVQAATEIVEGSAMAGVDTSIWIGLGVLAVILLLVLLDDDDDEDEGLPISP